MDKQKRLIHSRNVLMTNLLWFFFLFTTIINLVFAPEIIKLLLPVGIVSGIFLTLITKNKWVVWQTPYIIITTLFTYISILIIYEPILINYIYIWFALIVSSIYQHYKPILLAGIYCVGFTMFVFEQYYIEIFAVVEREDLIYIALFPILVTIFLIFASRFNEQLQLKMQQEKEEAEQLLQKSEKLAVVGQLAAGVAHEIKNPLAVITGFIQLMKKDATSNDYCSIMLKELERINLIINELLVFSKPHENIRTETNLTEIVSEVITLLKTQANMQSIDLLLLSDLTSGIVLCDKNKIKQVLINLYKNAIEAMPYGGTIKTEILEDEAYTTIRITDTGVGISSDHLHLICEPFFTTKETGTGLGLMVSHQIIGHHKGRLNFRSKENEGTTAEIMLPLAFKDRSWN